MYDAYLDVAERAAREAGEMLRGSFRKVTAREKGPGDLVTDADIASQRLIADRLLGAFPDSTLLGEEEGALPDPSIPWRWIVDPIDGTINFAHGNPLWCISIALEHRGELVVGVIHAPLLGTTYAACTGRGTTENGEPVRVSGRSRLSECLISTGFPTDFASDAERQLAYFRKFSTGTHSVRRTGTSAWNLALVSAGGFDLCYATTMNPWDAAAGVVLVREAGGVVTDLDGRPYDVYAPSILASNGHVHEETLRTLAGIAP